MFQRVWNKTQQISYKIQTSLYIISCINEKVLRCSENQPVWKRTGQAQNIYKHKYKTIGAAETNAETFLDLGQAGKRDYKFTLQRKITRLIAQTPNVLQPDATAAKPSSRAKKKVKRKRDKLGFDWELLVLFDVDQLKKKS